MSWISSPVGRFSADYHWPVLGDSRGSGRRRIPRANGNVVLSCFAANVFFGFSGIPFCFPVFIRLVQKSLIRSPPWRVPAIIGEPSNVRRREPSLRTQCIPVSSRSDKSAVPAQHTATVQNLATHGGDTSQEPSQAARARG